MELENADFIRGQIKSKVLEKTSSKHCEVRYFYSFRKPKRYNCLTVLI